MILKGIKRIYIQKKIKRALEQVSSQENGQNSKINSVLILIDENTSPSISKMISSRLAIDKRNIKTLIFKENPKKEQIVEGIVSEKDFSLFGNLKNEIIKKQLNQNVDLLLDYTVGNIFLNLITVLSKSKFKVGLSKNNTQLFDFLIDVKNNEIDVFNDELVKYLKILNKI